LFFGERGVWQQLIFTELTSANQVLARPASTALLSSLRRMNICAEFEEEKGGRWVATIREVPGARSYGSTRIEAAIGVTVRALRILKDEPDKVWIAGATDLLETMLAEFGEVGHTPNVETIVAFEEYERDGGKSFSSVEELMAELNADD
jgi:hypothetical protein